MIRIPRQLLIDRVYAVPVSGSSLWGDDISGTGELISNVRMEYTSKMTLDKQNEQVALAAILIYDCSNSKPSNFDFSHTERIVCGTKSYRIVKIDEMYDRRRLHHIEVELAL